MTSSFTVQIPAAVWMSSNGRYHWADRARRTRVLRAMAAAQCRRNHIHAEGPVRVVAEIGQMTILSTSSALTCAALPKRHRRASMQSLSDWRHDDAHIN